MSRPSLWGVSEPESASVSLTDEQKSWADGLAQLEDGLQRDRLAQYEAILGQIATGVFILEPTVRANPSSLEVTAVNETGVRFFGDLTAEGPGILREAEN